MTKAIVGTQNRLQQLASKREAGQGALEYLGMVVVAAVIVVALIVYFNTSGKALFTGIFSDAVNSVKGAKSTPVPSG